MASKKKVEKEGNDISDILSRYQRTVDPKPYDTGNFILNTIFGNGFPKNTFVELYSESGLGKTTISLSICRALCSQGKRVIYIDAEGGIENPLRLSEEDRKGNILHSMGMEKYLEDGSFILLNCNVNQINDIDVIVTKAVEKKDKDGFPLESDFALIVIDSVAALTDSSEMEGSNGIEKQQIGSFARMISNLMKRLNLLKKYGTSIILINQLREQLNVTGPGGNTGKTTTGGKSVKYFCDVRIKLEKAEWMKEKIDSNNKMFEKSEAIVGSYLRVTAEKNRGAKGNIPYILPVIFGKGVSNILTIAMALKNKKIVNFEGKTVNMIEEGSGGWMTVTLGGEETDVIRIQGQNKLNKLIAEKYDYIMENNLITQEDFQIKLGGADTYGEQ